MSLKEQLLKAGLADAKKLKAINKEKHLQRKQAGKKQPPVNEATVLAEQKRQQQIARDQELNRQKQAELNQKAIAAQVKQLIDNNTVVAKGEVAFNFTDDKLVKRIYVSQTQQNELTRGLLAVAGMQQRYYLIPAQVAEKIQQRMPESILVLNSRQQKPDEDDPYADYQIPDDLMW